MKTSYIAAGLLVLALGLWMASGAFSSDDAASEAAGDQNTTGEQNSASGSDTTPLAKPIKVEYIDVQLEPRSRDIILQGQLEPRRHLQMRAETSSIVETISIEKGARVNKGDTIVSLSLDGRETDLMEAQAQLQTARSQQKAAASLRQKGLQSQVQLEQTQAQLASARAQLSRIQRDIENTKIIAPFGGLVNAVPVEVGEMVDRGAVVAELVDNSRFIVTAQVAQQLLSQLTLNADIDVKLITGDTLPGKLTYISSVADAASRSFSVEAEVDNVDGKYAAGVSASLVVPIEKVEAIFITPSALSLGDDGGLGVKIIDENDEVVFTPIDLVSSTLEGAWVTGIPDNSKVITLGQGFVKPGQKVEPVKAATASEEAS